MTSLKSSESVNINKTGLLFFITVGLSVGIAPATLAIGQPEALVLLTISTLIGAYWHIKGFKSLATEKPKFLEYVIGSIGVVIWGVLTSGFLLISYLISLGGTYLIEFIGSSLGFGTTLNAHFIAYVISVVVAFIFNVIWAGAGAGVLAKQLYPNKARLRSVFYELASYRKRQLSSYFGFALLVLGGLLLVVWSITGVMAVWNIWWFNVIFLIYLFFISIFPFSMGDIFDTRLARGVNAVSALLNALEYEVKNSPMTGRPDYDPLIAGLDFFAQKEESALAVVVRTEDSSRSDNWAPSSLLGAVWALEDFFQEEQNGIDRIIPVVFFIGTKKEKWRENVKVVRMTDEQMNQILEMEHRGNQTELKRMAGRFLNVSHKRKDYGTSKDSLIVSGGKA